MAPSRALCPAVSVGAQCLRQQRLAKRTFTTSSPRQAEGSYTPRVADVSLWRSLVPKFLRRDREASPAKPNSKEWNPATIFIVLGILVGSNAINILSLKRETLNFSRKTDAKLGLLREVLQRVKNGEDVDVEKLLGTGDAKSEQEWEDVMQELESTNMLAEAERKKQAKKAERDTKRLAEAERGLEVQAKEGPGAVPHTGQEGAKSGRPKFLM